VFESACGTDKISPERNAAEEEFKKIGEHYYKVFAEGGMLITFCIWIAGTGAIRFAIMHYMGYLVKAGHIAVIAEACKRGRIPKNQVAYGKQKVKERFATANIYFAVDKLVTSAVKQIQKNIDKAGDKLDFIPSMNAISGAAKLFVDISLGYIDECCLEWTFYQNQQGALQSAAEGVVIYAQNWKVLLKHAAKTMLKTILILLGIVLAAFVPVGLIFKLLKWSPLAAFLIACLIAWVVKFAVIDSYIMIQMMGTYMEVAPQTPWQGKELTAPRPVPTANMMNGPARLRPAGPLRRNAPVPPSVQIAARGTKPEPVSARIAVKKSSDGFSAGKKTTLAYRKGCFFALSALKGDFLSYFAYL